MVYEIILIRILNWHGRKTKFYESDKHLLRTYYRSALSGAENKSGKHGR